MGLFDFFSGDAQKEAAQARIAGLQAGQREANTSIDAGLGQFKDYYKQAGDYFAPLAGVAGARTGAYDDATGVNGAEGMARARAIFTATPGYQEGLDLSLDQLDRRAAARGMLGSGNTVADATKLATTYANQAYGDYVSRLAPFVGQDAAVAGARAGLTTKVGDKSYDAGALKGGIGFQTQQGIGNANADAAMADYNASGNMWNTILGAGKVAASIWG